MQLPIYDKIIKISQAFCIVSFKCCYRQCIEVGKKVCTNISINHNLGALSKSSISLITPPQERPKSASGAKRDWLTFTASAAFR